MVEYRPAKPTNILYGPRRKMQAPVLRAVAHNIVSITGARLPTAKR